MTTIYRVTRRTTSCRQPGETYWQHEVLYTGIRRDEALVSYYTSEPTDHSAGYGNPASETIIESVDADAVEDVDNPPRMTALEV